MRGSAARITDLWNAASEAGEAAARKAESATNLTRLESALADFDLAVSRVREAVSIIAADQARDARKVPVNA